MHRHYVQAETVLFICYCYNEDRYEEINILGTRYFVLLSATLGVRQAHGTSVRLIFPPLQ